ncbi:RAD52 family DNA repair protein [Mameliella alba]|uniref:RAD52 family DNA repair protein n=1 Tax=Mameliella alba TaxID=561184 RepID=UPI000B52F13F|nr:RAD52 family DNA repair protein [Mameliella alba]OWV44235.1 hypothetical protein CDZ95_05995 [Mameliella alba]
MDWEAARPLLDAKLDPASVKKPEGRFGPKGDYIEGWHAIAEANRIFGHGNWSYTIKTMTQDSLREGKTGKGDMQWQAAYTCIVTLRVGDVVREDVGFGSGFAKQIGDAIEGATKEAVTDALKRALRTFGWPFGLALYDKQRGHVGVDAPPPPPPAEVRDRILSAINRAETVEALDALWKHPATGKAITGLPEPMRAELIKAHSDRTAQVFQAPPDKDHAYG